MSRTPICVVALMVMLMMFAAPSSWAAVALLFGDEGGKVAFYNSSNHPDSEEPVPLGPLSFRVDGNEFWVADSVAGRVYRLDGNGKVLTTIKVATGDIVLLEDIGLARGPDGAVTSVWVLSGGKQEIAQFSPDGKPLKIFGGRGEGPGQFLQIHRIEVGASGRLYIADKGRQKIFVFGPDLKLEREETWQWSGFCLDEKENLCRLLWDDKAKVTKLVVQSPDGKPVKTVVLDIGKHSDPELWFMNAKGEACLTFVPPEGFKGTFKFAACGANGKPVLVTDLKPPLAMNRFIDQAAKGSLFLGVADYTNAPKGDFKIEPWSAK